MSRTFNQKHPSAGRNNSNNNHHHHNQNQNRNNTPSRNQKKDSEPQITQFVLGTKELDDKNAEFFYDKGWYSIIDIIGEERNTIYKSKNAQEAYTKWNVYIGRKKERPQRAEKVEN